jgi:hypothetical protein
VTRWWRKVKHELNEAIKPASIAEQSIKPQQALQSSMMPSSQQSIAEQSSKPEQDRASLECKAINQSSQHYKHVMSSRNL